MAWVPARPQRLVGRGWPRREAGLGLIWRWRGVSKLEGELAEASGRLLSTGQETLILICRPSPHTCAISTVSADSISDADAPPVADGPPPPPPPPPPLEAAATRLFESVSGCHTSAASARDCLVASTVGTPAAAEAAPAAALGGEAGPASAGPRAARDWSHLPQSTRSRALYRST